MKRKRFLVFSDLHYSPDRQVFDGSKNDNKLLEFAEPLLEQLIQEANHTIHPDFVLFLGDLVDDPKDHNKHVRGFQIIWNKLKEFQAPLYALTGNHELRSFLSREEVEHLMGYSHSTFSVDLAGIHVVMLSTYVRPNSDEVLKTNYISEEDLLWLENDLNRNQLPCVVCVHFGVAEDDMKGNRWFAESPERALLQNRRELKEILKKHSILGVFSGHQHWTKELQEDGIHYYVVGSMTENVQDEGVPDGVYFVVDFDGERLSVSERHIRL